MHSKPNGIAQQMNGDGRRRNGSVAGVIAPPQQASQAPQNLEAERALICAVIADNHTLDGVERVVTSVDFAEPRNAAAWSAIVRLIGTGRAADPATIAGELGGTVEAHEYIRSLGGVGRPSRAGDYAAQVAEFAKRRRLFSLAQMIATKIGRGDPAGPLIEDVIAALFRLGRHNEGIRSIPASDAIASVASATREASVGSSTTTIATGLRAIDGKMKLRPGNLFVLAGRPSHGKTTLALQIGRHMAEAGEGVSFFSLEMTAEELSEQHLTQEVPGITREALADGGCAPEQLEAIDRLAVDMRDVPLIYHDAGEMNVSQLEMLARRDVVHRGTKVLIIDYLQKVQPDPEAMSFSAQGHEKVSHVVQRIKGIAKNLKVAIIALAQMNQEFDRRNMNLITSKKKDNDAIADDIDAPSVTDLAGSAQILREADAVCFIWRPALMMRGQEPQDKSSIEWIDWEGRRKHLASQGAKLFFPKIRAGKAPAWSRLFFNEHRVRFEDVDYQH